MTERVAILEIIVYETAAFKVKQERSADANISKMNERGLL